ncbi:MAG: hypothetical protein GY741_17375, partial [Phycisphaeraceae bacterium]|nr:hypothetical protein [Phycisphaeraceae bacterium]
MFIAWMPAATAIAEDALEATGSNIRAWGSMSFNRPIGPDDEVVQLAAGYGHTAALLSDGSIACWGYNRRGQCDLPSGIGTSANPAVSLAVAGFEDSDEHAVAVRSDGSIVCWGSNDFGQCDVPSNVGTPGNPVVGAAVGYLHTVALLSDGSIACWGWNGSGQCDVPSGIGTPANPVASIAAGGSHTVALLTD